MTTKTLDSYFKNQSLLDLAFTHKSWVNEHQKLRESNERLEFLGDAVLEFVVSKELFIAFPSKEEGYLTSLRANLVNTVNLSEVAKKLDIGKRLFLSKGEEDGGGRDNQSMLADSIEAIIGAIYIDSGIDAAENFIKEYILSDVKEKISEPLKDAKSRLQELIQATNANPPRYEVVKESGPDHDKIFDVEVYVDSKPLGKGTGRSKNEAAQNAASNALEVLPEK